MVALSRRQTTTSELVRTFGAAEFLIADDGRTTRPQGGGVVILPSERSASYSTMTITVSQTNDAPVFNSSALVNVLERDDNGDTA